MNYLDRLPSEDGRIGTNRRQADRKKRKKLRDRLERLGAPQADIDAAVERLRADQALVRAIKRGPDHDMRYPAHELAYEPPSDSGYKPAPVDPLLKGAARATGATAKAVRRGKAVTKYEHLEID